MKTAAPIKKPSKKKKPVWPTIRRRVNKSGTVSWCVDPGKRLGERERFFFGTEAEAETKADQLRVRLVNEGRSSASLSDRERADAAECTKRLAPLGISMIEAVDFYIRHARPTGGTKTVSALVDEFLAAKRAGNRKESYLEIQRHVLGGVLVRQFGTRLVNELGHVEIDEWMNAQPWVARTRKNYFTDVSNLLGFAVKKGYLAENPMSRLDKPLVTDKSPGVLTPAQAKAFLGAAGQGTGAMLPAVALGLFAGLRSAELELLEWQHINLAEQLIEITPDIAKTREGRFVEMADCLVAWLAPVSKSDGPIGPRLAFNYHLGVVAKAAKIVPWPKNAMRHTFASCHLAQHKNAPLTASQLGHMGSPQTLFKRYAKRVSPSDASKFWGILPKG